MTRIKSRQENQQWARVLSPVLSPRCRSEICVVDVSDHRIFLAETTYWPHVLDICAQSNGSFFWVVSFLVVVDASSKEGDDDETCHAPATANPHRPTELPPALAHVDFINRLRQPPGRTTRTYPSLERESAHDLTACFCCNSLVLPASKAGSLLPLFLPSYYLLQLRSMEAVLLPPQLHHVYYAFHAPTWNCLFNAHS